MKDILDQIIAHKRLEVEQLKRQMKIADLEASIYFDRSCISMRHFILHPTKSGIIAEFKRRSPSKGSINAHSKVADVTNTYVEAGVSGISVLTDTHFFGGHVDDLKKTRAVNYIPILRKDFIIDEYQILEAKAIGADVILLIGECLSKQEVRKLSAFAAGLGLEVLFELHGEDQIDKITDDIHLVGINNRNLKTFEVDLAHSIALCQKLPDHLIKVSESGISNPETIVDLKKEGFQGFLIGENFMKTQDPGKSAIDFIAHINSLETVAL